MYKINPRLPEPIYIQIMNSIKDNIFLGLAKPGEKIPSVRDMAKILTANPNTVAKAYKELERESVIEVLKGKGTFIAIDVVNNLKSNDKEISKIQKTIKDLVNKSKYYGISAEQLKKWIDENEEAAIDNSK